MPREYLFECNIYRTIIYEIEIEIRGEPVEIIEKIASSPSLKCQVLTDIALKYLLKYLEHDESVFFSIEHSWI